MKVKLRKILIINYRFGTLKRLMPGDYYVVRLRAKGRQIWRSLENAVSKFPALEGRYPIVSLIFLN